MITKNTYFFWVLLSLFLLNCKTNTQQPIANSTKTEPTHVIVGAAQLDSYLPFILGKKVAIVGNQTSIIQNIENSMPNFVHLVDTLLASDINITKVFSPEHGFRGKADAGEKVMDGFDVKSRLPIVSLYGSNKKPKPEQLKGIDIILFDLQDVGVRFYTYISTLHYVMEAAAEAKIPIIVLDRPNPNAHYIDGPVLEEKHHSFVGMHQVPIVYGMTIAEYAQMINGEHWLNNGLQCNLNIIPIKNYSHKTPYELPVKPSPNLPNAKAVNFYPSLCLFEGTTISCGRGTDKQFQLFGAPKLPVEKYAYTFVPLPNEGAKHPKHENKLCHGMDLQKTPELNGIELQYLLDAYSYYPDRQEFFNSFFTKLAGTEALQNQVELGYTAADIKKTWQPGLEKFKKTRLKYLLYE